jgi:murein L,D-transpeptidase YcbB/YkuD
MEGFARLIGAAVVAAALGAPLAIGVFSDASAARPIPVAAPAPGPAHAPVEISDDIAAFYRDRDFQPLWLAGNGFAPEAVQLMRMLGNDADGELRTAIRAARNRDPHRLTRADILLSRAFVAHIQALHRPPAANAMRYIDPGLAPAARSGREILDAAARAPSLADHLTEAERVNPVYDGLRKGLAGFRGTDQQRRLILANMERARAIPARPHGRYILVDAASARLWMIEDGRIAGAMRVVVGKRAMPSPVMAGLIRYAALNPVWNLPPDLIRKRARGGARAIRAEHLQALSDWSPQARLLDPGKVDWRAVAAGRRLVNLRQTPGPHNMMGRIKFMMPNDLGVYLHDTPLRDLLAQADRHESSGCVRLEDAPRLARWLFYDRVPRASGAAEQRADLPMPVPVYIGYFTALPSRDGIVFQRDVYRRDPGAERRRPAASAPARHAVNHRPRRARRA